MRGQINLRRTAGLALAAAFSLFTAHEAAAQSCQTDTDCGAGYRCHVQSGVSCGVTCGPTWGDGGAPLPETEVPVSLDLDAGVFTDGGTSRDAGFVDAWIPCEIADAGCTPYEYSYCTAAPCSSDSDCPSDMACHTQTWQECSGGSACKPGYPCADAGSFSCTERSEGTCQERYNLPCQTDPDCGEGWECKWYETTSCSGGGTVTPNGDGGFIFTDAGSSCTTEPSTSGYCNLLELPCTSDTECPTDMTCQVMWSWPPCGPFPSDAGTSAPDAGADAPLPVKDYDAGYYSCPPPEQSTACRPARWGGTVGGGTVGGGGFFGGTGGTGAVDAGVGTSADASAPPTNGGGSAGGAIGGTGGSTDPGTKPGAGSGPGGEEDDDDGRPDHPRGGKLRSILRHLFGGGSSGGCSVGAQPAQGNLGWLALMSLFLVWRGARRSDD